MKPYIKLIKNNWLEGVDKGWGNGYVVLPKGHKYHGKDYDELGEIEIHGGLTYSKPDINDTWCIGFDTCHASDTLERWSLERVEQEAQRLLEQVL